MQLEVDTAAEWRDCQRFTGYRVSSDGELQSCWKSRGNAGRFRTDSWRTIPGTIGSHGYLHVRVTDATGRRTNACIHVIVCEAFHGPRPSPEMKARHLNDIRTDNRSDNLAWGTQLDNMADQERNGNRRRGEMVPAAILTASDVISIRQLIESGTTYKNIAAQFGVTWYAIRNIARGATWKHV